MTSYSPLAPLGPASLCRAPVLPSVQVCCVCDERRGLWVSAHLAWEPCLCVMGEAGTPWGFPSSCGIQNPQAAFPRAKSLEAWLRKRAP